MTVTTGPASRRARLAIWVALACVAIAAPSSWAAKPKKKPPAPPPPIAAMAELPTDLNQASLRVSAMQALYELDASSDQIRALRAAASGLADSSERTSPKPSAKLTAAIVALRDALVAGGDDKRISEARNAFADESAEAELDDAIHPSQGARLKGATLSRTFTAGQLAAYLAAHADEVVGPAERLAAAATDLRDDPPEEADAEIKQVSTEVGVLVAGSDGAKATAVAGKSAEWLRANRAAAVDSPEGQAKLEASARAVVGDVSPVEVLGHWFEDEVAQLLANPQFPEAATALLAAKESH